MSNTTITTTVQATLELIFRNGARGLFPVGTLRSNIGTFACNEKWLETLEAGSYDGQFDIEEIKLCHYVMQNYVPEFRVYNKAIIKNYRFDNMSGEVEPSEFAFMDDPLNEEEPKAMEKPVMVASEPEDDLPDWLKDDEPKSTLFNDDTPETVLFIRDKLRSVGNDSEWNMGDDMIVPAEIDRVDQRKIVKMLKDNGYRLIEPNQRLWSMTAEVANV